LREVMEQQQQKTTNLIWLQGLLLRFSTQLWRKLG
jgi:hypothetical protein